eukprot:1338853-Rhodomonas_salina.2
MVRVWDTALLPRSERTQPAADTSVLLSAAAATESEHVTVCAAAPSEPQRAQREQQPAHVRAEVVSVHTECQSHVVSAVGWRLPPVQGRVQVQVQGSTEPLRDAGAAARPEGGDRGVCEGHAEAVTCVAVSGSGLVAASGSRDAVVRVWDTATGRAVGKRLEGHKKRVTAVALSWDGKTVVSGGADKTVRVWGWERELCCFTGHKMLVLSVAVSACGGRVVSGGKETKESVR